MEVLKKKFGRKSKAPDSPALSGRHKQARNVQQQERWLHEVQAASSTTSSSPEAPSTSPDRLNRQAAAPQALPLSSQADWFTAAMQSSAQLSDMAAPPQQDESQQEGKLSPKSKKSAGKRRKAHQQVQHDEQDSQYDTESKNDDWFNQAVMQSTQLSQMGASNGH